MVGWFPLGRAAGALGPVPVPDLEAFERLTVLLFEAPPVLRAFSFFESRSSPPDQAGRANAAATKERPVKQNARARKIRRFV
jgi:hypothetical protein